MSVRLEAIPDTESAAIRQHFDETSFVCIEGLYAAVCAPAAVCDMRELFSGRYYPDRGEGEETGQLKTMPRAQREPALYQVVEGMQAGALAVGRDIITPRPRTKPRLLRIEMEPGATGKSHVDHGLSEAVAITTLQGESELWFEGRDGRDDAMCTLRPGVVALHDPAKRIVHQAFNRTSEKRVGLTAIRRQLAA